MLYKADTQTIIEVVAPGVTVSEERMAELAQAIGGQTSTGEPIATVALVFIGGPAEAEAHLPNIKRFGLQCRAIELGVEKVLHEGSRVLRGSGEIRGTLLPVLREASWPQIETCAYRRLLVGANITEGPFVTFGWDEGNTITRFQPKHLGTKTIGDVEGEAVANLAKRTDLKVERKDAIISVTGEYGSEAILMRDFVKKLQSDLSCQLMIVAVPKEGGFIAASAEDMQQTMGLLMWSKKIFDEAKGRRVSPLPFMVQDGAIIGYATATSEDDKPASPTKPWWKFW